MTEIIWRQAGEECRTGTCLDHRRWSVGDYLPLAWGNGERLLLRIERRVVPMDDAENVQLRCVIAAEDVRAEIFGESDCEQ